MSESSNVSTSNKLLKALLIIVPIVLLVIGIIVTAVILTSNKSPTSSNNTQPPGVSPDQPDFSPPDGGTGSTGGSRPIYKYQSLTTLNKPLYNQGNCVAISSDGSIIASSAEGNSPSPLGCGIVVYRYSQGSQRWIESSIIDPPSGLTIRNYPVFARVMVMNGVGNRIIANSPIDLSGQGTIWVFDSNASNNWNMNQKITTSYPNETTPFLGLIMAVSGNGNVLMAYDKQRISIWKYQSGEYKLFNIQGRTYNSLHPFLLSANLVFAINYLGNIAVIGSPLDGKLYIYTETSNSWSFGFIDNKIDGINNFHRSLDNNYAFGTSLDIDYSGDIICTFLKTNNVYYLSIYKRTLNDNWITQQSINLNTDIGNSFRPTSCSISGNGNIIAISDMKYEPKNTQSGETSGIVLIYKKNENNIYTKYRTITRDGIQNQGVSLALNENGSVLVVGSDFSVFSGVSGIGAVYVISEYL